MIRGALPQPVGLVLPDHVGRARYGLPGVSLVDQRGRPLTYTLDVDGRPITVMNAIEERNRIPVDELHDMAVEGARRRVNRGDAQKTADTNRMMQEWWEDRKNWREDHRNSRQSFGLATWSGDRKR